MNALVQSIERSVHLIHKSRFSIKEQKFKQVKNFLSVLKMAATIYDKDNCLAVLIVATYLKVPAIVQFKKKPSDSYFIFLNKYNAIFNSLNDLPGECRKAVSLSSFIKSTYTSRMQLQILLDFSNLYRKTFQMFLIVSLSNVL